MNEPDPVPAPRGALATPPPAAAARQGERALAEFEQALERAGEDPPASPGWREAAGRVFAASEFVARLARQRPRALRDLLAGGRLLADESVDSFRERLQARVDAEVADGDEAALMRVLRRFRVEEGVRIAWRDLAGYAGIETCLAEQSDLAESCIQLALGWLDAQLAARHGAPAGADGERESLLVLAMGKLGGRELNFSSDIDLIFVHGTPGRTGGAQPLDHGDYFTRLGQALIRVLGQRTADGFAYRVDLRLRPFGDSGPLVVHAGQLEQYLLSQAREWERFALVKARPLSGDKATRESIEALLRPFVYRRYLDFGAFEALRDLKARLEREVARKGLHGNVKYGRGGIREIEFIAQAFQLIRGGREPALRCRGLLAALDGLAGTGDVDPSEVATLSDAYRELRRVENRLQSWSDDRVHALPRDTEARARLAWTLGHADWDEFEQALQTSMGAVHECFGHVFNVEEDGAGSTGDDGLAAVWEGELDESDAHQRLKSAGFADAGEALRRLATLRDSARYRGLSATARARLDRLLPALIADSGRGETPDATLARVLDLVEAIASRSVYLSL
ncbi:MAG: bifunctional [glutamate--ammonia ligase]-adenylyl-L-tyrosine phosphorylase/[glutamate--ammonia-ligase] adenylyltransferase, partial [Halofilum sp. (in: g-proteobacteria)]|nr:bifunctional [glutamate--ammonia ligase]-adenylyl-L-tyrosine phosphorylase/[glutamate--ammonia-ligase] adenylyltransferase [Halofilum sp. (in: g-proteobacteria)]